MKITIFVEGPFDSKIDRSKLAINGAGQLIAFDGKSTRAKAESACAQLAPHCQCVVAFSGSNVIGRLIIHWHKGIKQKIDPDFERCDNPKCSYCGGTFFATQH